MAISPSVYQQQMMNECETVPVTITTSRVTEQDFLIAQCRSKDNFYGEFGEWRITGEPQFKENDNG